MNNHYIRNTCRLCKSENLKIILNLTPTALCDAYITEQKEQEVYPLDLQKCEECNFVQINCVVNPEVIYKDYIYETKSSFGLSDHFQNYATEVLNKLNFSKNSSVLDIGSNDGTLLYHFKKNGMKTLGIEPASITAKVANENGIETICDFFNLELQKSLEIKYGKFDLITINNLFANIDDLDSIITGINNLLTKNGVFIIESSYLFDMIDNMVFDFIYHEHLSYFSLLPLKKFFDKFDFHLIDIQHVETKGGSMRYYWARKDSNWSVNENVNYWFNFEFNKLNDKDYFSSFALRIEKEKNDLLQELKKYEGRKIIGFGASATSTTFIYHFELGNKLSNLVDENPGKFNTLSPGYHIPVYEFKNTNEKSDEVAIILAWRYYKQIIPKIKGKYYKIITPLPQLETE
ncbi:methyltransferase domain-containing protein [Silvanigrella sp.]|jgi:hypothetical protein|uniref:methyltransferase domain-containing protein n=1 Tax=Silvanigrella sp. TaxID=2024976 RepID=UPI0037C57CBC